MRGKGEEPNLTLVKLRLNVDRSPQDKDFYLSPLGGRGRKVFALI
jgi:hypothetical protein